MSGDTIPPKSPLIPGPGAAPLAPLPNRPNLAPLQASNIGPALSKPPIPPLVSPSPMSAKSALSAEPAAAGVSISGAPALQAAREPASLDGLTSPAAMAKSGSRTSRASLAPAPLRTTDPKPGRPEDGLGSAADGMPPAPLPGAIPTPTGASSGGAAGRAAPGAVHAVAAGDGAPAAIAAPEGPKPIRKPSPHDPPKELLKDVTPNDKGTFDDRMIEEYIPFGFVELREKLLVDHKDVFRDEQLRKKFVELTRLISLRNTLRLEIDYGDAHEKYALLDPDKDTLVFKAEAVAAAAGGKNSDGGATAVTPLLPQGNLRARVDAMYGELDNILNKAEFQELPKEELDKAANDKSLMGLDVITASDEYLESRIHYRGSRTKKIQFRRWGLFKRQIEMNVYERLAITFRLKKPVCEEDAPDDPLMTAAVDRRPWYKRMCGRRVKIAPSLFELRDEYLYMKLFKDVLQCDVDMLLPGAIIKFTWFDYVMIWAPILFGCGAAIWKAVKGTIDFSNLINAVLSVVLIIMPITWGIRAYMSIKEKQRLHQAHLNALFILHNLNNNSGVISQLLDEAQEQEDNECMLAYFFLWRGEASPQEVRKLDLDREVEKYLQGKIDETGVRVRLDFEVVESIVKLERLGLIRTAGEGRDKMLQALPIDEALEKAHVRHFDERRETGQVELPRSEIRRQGVVPRWHECVDIFRPTGQKFRYYWNAETGESQYHEPDEQYIKLSGDEALDFDDAHGIAMADPAKQVGASSSLIKNAKSA